MFHAEFYDRYRREIPAKMARYGGSLAGQYSLPVESVALLLSSDGCPDVAPEVGIYRIGKTTTTHEFRTVKLWELDPEPVLESGDPAILPWALLMRLGREGARKIGAKVAETRDEASISRFLLLGELRYDRAEVEEMLGGNAVPLAEALVLGSSTLRRSVEEAEAKGKAQGKTEEVRRLLKLILAREHPGLEASPEIDRIQDIGKLESLLVDYSRGSSREIVELAIRAAAQSQ